jgi:hypothetical protein
MIIDEVKHATYLSLSSSFCLIKKKQKIKASHLSRQNCGLFAEKFEGPRCCDSCCLLYPVQRYDVAYSLYSVGRLQTFLTASFLVLLPGNLQCLQGSSAGLKLVFSTNPLLY